MSAVVLQEVSKTYSRYARPVDRILEVITGNSRHSTFTALKPTALVLERGEVLGLIGMNGAGKSTLLKLIAGTILASSGSVQVNGRVSALLELGSGFHPDMSGRENVYLSGAVQGLSRAQIDALYSDIVAFSGMSEFMEQPVKTYSSGMFMRLAFSVATCVQPDILIIDEALSVGDGAFALKSFKRIMEFKEAGSTILFCTHSLYQVEALCSRAIWVHQGRIVCDGMPADVTSAYSQFTESGLMPGEKNSGTTELHLESAVLQSTTPEAVLDGQARIRTISIRVGAEEGRELELESAQDDLGVTVEFSSDPKIENPALAVTLVRADSSIVASASSKNDMFTVQRRADGSASVTLVFNKLPLLKGEYWVTVFLGCERALHVYDHAEMVAKVVVKQRGLEQGVVSLPHMWQMENPTT